MTHTKEQLSEMKLPQLRGIAKDLGVNSAGLRPADLVREILKAQDAAKPAAKTEKKAEPKKAAAKPAPAKKAEDPVLKALKAIVERMDVIASKVNALAEYCDMEPLSDADIDLDFSAAPVAAPTEEEAVEEETEEEEEETPPPPPKKAEAPKKAAPKAPEPEEEEESDEEEEEELNIDLDDLDNMNLEQLQEVAKQLNDAGYDDTVEYEGVTSPRVLRKKLKDWLLAHGEKTVDEEPVSEKAEEEEAEEAEEEELPADRPDFLVEGAKVMVDFEEEGGKLAGVVVSINDKEQTAEVTLDDGEEVEAPWETISKRETKPKPRPTKK